jgi:hypothetical protein
MKYSGTVEYEGIVFEIEGDYVPYHGGKAYSKRGDPGDAPEGGYFEEFDILINGVSICELLLTSAVNAIGEIAEEQAALEHKAA